MRSMVWMSSMGTGASGVDRSRQPTRRRSPRAPEWVSRRGLGRLRRLVDEAPRPGRGAWVLSGPSVRPDRREDDTTAPRGRSLALARKIDPRILDTGAGSPRGRRRRARRYADRVSTTTFEVSEAYQPTGDQPQAIRELSAGLRRGDPFQTLLGVTGSGQTFTMARVLAEVARPALVT